MPKWKVKSEMAFKKDDPVFVVIGTRFCDRDEPVEVLSGIVCQRRCLAGEVEPSNYVVETLAPWKVSNYGSYDVFAEEKRAIERGMAVQHCRIEEITHKLNWHQESLQKLQERHVELVNQED